MNSLNDIRAYLSKGYRVFNVIAIALILMIVLGYLFFVRTSITPATQASQDLTNRLAAAKKDLRQKQNQIAASPQKLQDDLRVAQVALAEQSRIFITSAQAASILDQLYQYATEAGVDIVELQSRPLTQTQVVAAPPTARPLAPTAPPSTAAAKTSTPAAKGKAAPTPPTAPPPTAPPPRPTVAVDRRVLYEPKIYHLVVQGSVLSLTGFVARIREASTRAVAISNVSIAEGAKGYALAMDLTLYVSALAPTATPTGAASASAPAPPAATTTAQPPRSSATPSASPGPSVNPLLVRPTNWPTEWPWPPQKPGAKTPVARGTQAAEFALQTEGR